MLIGHWLAYRVSIPDPHDRGHSLALTGHGYLRWMVMLVTAAAVVALGRAIALGFSEPSRRRPFASTWMVLAAIQTGGFLGLEIGERLVSGHGLADVLALDGPVLVGLLLQLVVALGLALLLRALGAVIEWVRRGGIDSERRASTPRARTQVVAGRGRWFTPCSLRGPPILN